MRFSFPLHQETLLQYMRRNGYAPEGPDEETGEIRFARPARSGRYPRFHLYCRTEGGTASCNLHVDQKAPSYRGTPAHSGEYEGPLVEQEAARIQQAARA